MKVLIAGGGIGGLATALSLHAVGVECEVFEQSTTARATVWLDSPALPGPVVARLRTGPQPLGELPGPLGMRRRTLRANRLCDYGRPLEHDDQDRAVLLVSAALEVAHERVALVEETYLEPVLW